jgi:hypothetical protein
VKQVIHEARQVNEWLAINLLVRQYVIALKRLVSDLYDRASEAKAEVHPGPDVGPYYRDLFCRCVQQFWCSVGRPDAAGTTIVHGRVYDLTAAFAVNLHELLAGAGRSLILDPAAGPLPPRDWADTIQIAALRAETLARELQVFVDELQTELSKNARLCREMDDATERLSKVL